MGRRQKRTTRINKDKILLAATRLIKERGVAGLSLADISAEVGISKGTLYYYYPSKSALVFDITEQNMNHMTAKIIQWIEKSSQGTRPKDILKVVLETILKGRARGQVHLYLIQEAMNDEILRRRFSQEYAKWGSMFEQGLNKIFPGNPENAVLAKLMLAAVYGLLIQGLLGGEKPATDRIAGFLAATVRT
jgi:AcrR family transcriptional regulator